MLSAGLMVKKGEDDRRIHDAFVAPALHLILFKLLGILLGFYELLLTDASHLISMSPGKCNTTLQHK